MRSQGSDSVGARAELWIGLALCAAVVLGWAWQQHVPNPDGPQASAPDWLPLIAAGSPRQGSCPWLVRPAGCVCSGRCLRQPPPARSAGRPVRPKGCVFTPCRSQRPGAKRSEHWLKQDTDPAAMPIIAPLPGT